MTGRDSDDDRVGYSRPPKESQFKKGQSGNPNGRPKGGKASQGVITTLEKVMGQKVETTVKGRVKRISLYEVILTQFAGAAAKGNVSAQKELLRLLHSAELNREEPLPALEANDTSKSLFDISGVIHEMGVAHSFEDLCFRLGIGFMGDDGEIYLHPKIAKAALDMNVAEPWKIGFPLHAKCATPELLARGLTSPDEALLARIQRVAGALLGKDSSSS